MAEEKGKQAEERQDEPRLWRPWRPPRRRMGWRVLWAVGMVVALMVALLTTALLIVPLHPEIWKDLLEGRVLTLVALGISLTALVVMLAIAGARRSWTGFQGKTVWDFLQLLIVPLMLVAIGLVFSLQQDARQQRVEDQRVDAERKLAAQRAQDEALQAYLSQMGSLLLEKDLRDADKDSEVSTLARARTVTVLQRLDADRNKTVIRFLTEARLIGTSIGLLVEADLQGTNLEGSDLRDANLSGADLNRADLSGADLSKTDLRNARLRGANLNWASLRGVEMSGADLSDAHLFNADLSDANLSGAVLSDANLSDARLNDADLSGVLLFNADLSEASLSGANLNGAHLNDANLNDANLNDALGITNEELEQQAAALEGATMPNGQKYEDWLKDR